MQNHEPPIIHSMALAYLSGVSAVILLLQVLLLPLSQKLHTRRWQDLRSTSTQETGLDDSASENSYVSNTKGFALQQGDHVIYGYRCARFIGCLALWGLSFGSFLPRVQEDSHVFGHQLCSSATQCHQFALCVTAGYASLLGFISITTRSRWSKPASTHLSILLLAIFAIFALRDLFPLATFTMQPEDIDEGWLLWAKITILALIGVLLPLITPRQYIPFDPAEPAKSPHPEQTASWLSMLFYIWEEPIVYLAYKSPHLSHEQLHPMADRDYCRNLVKSSFGHLDPFSGSQKRHLFFGLLKVFRLEYAIMTLAMVIDALSNLASPMGINYLLEYIETDGKGAIIRPWVWIAWLFLGPMAGSLSFQWYIFIATRVLVRTEGIITQLVFSHSLRIRMKAEGPDDKQQVSDANTPSAPDTTSINGSDPRNGEVDTDEATEDTLRTSSTGEVPLMAAGKQKAPQTKKTGDERGPKSNTSNLIGKINNLVSSDLNNITEGRDFLMLCLYTPLQIGLSIWFLYGILGWSALVGLATMVVSFPIPGYVARMFQTVQVQKMKTTDARVQTVTETMNVLRMVKLFGWGPKMDRKITEKREEELRLIWKQKILEIANNNVGFVIPLFTMLSTYSTYTLVMGQSLSAAKVFSSISIFDILRGQVSQVFSMIPQLVQAKVSLDRLNGFLLDTELLDEFSQPEQEEHFLTRREDLADAIGFRNAVFSWSDDTNGTLTPSKRRFTLNIADELFFKRGHINLIVGPTGSGKTSMLMALLGEMHFIPSDTTSWYGLPRSEGVAYAAQESWVQNETIRDNILFGAPYEEGRYRKVLYQCALERDLTLYEFGDQTEVGEKGLTLSGGQKARITLARAVYSSAQILLLDDTLAALDVHTSQWIVNKCLAGDLVQGRTVLMVTHNVAMASSVAHFVVSLGTHGRIVSRGPITEIIERDANLATEMVQDEEALERESETVEADAQIKTEVRADGKLVVAEEILVGTVSWPAFKFYFISLGGDHPLLFSIIFFALMGLTDLMNTMQTWFLGYWASQYEIQSTSEVKVPFYLSVYALLLVSSCVAYSIGNAVYIHGTMRASLKIHGRLIQSVLGTTLRWLDITPTSRVITRCTQDIQAIDEDLARSVGFMIELTITILIRLGVIVFMTPAFLLPGIIVGVVGGFVGRTYIKAQLSVKREMSNAKAPVLGHFGAAVTGLTSIRAYGAQEAFKRESLTRIDRYTKCARMFYNLNCWLSVRLDVISALFTSSLAAYLVYGNSALNASDIGFSLNMAVVFSALILWWVSGLNDVEISGNSLERIDEYINIEQEPKSTESGQPPAYWPASGDLRVENLSARYSSDGLKVLHDLSFHIASGERVGIVGRTGSGKSSLTLSLLRCIFTEGNVYYDGIPTSSINLEILRSNITVIPQVPELLAGTLRQNLDPFDQHDDAVLNNALRSAGLFELHKDDDDGRLTLESDISSAGSNLSVGQRQILALARAMVRESKLLILDEATSAIDYKTDTLIQSSLRNELRDVTQIIVAHRLQTIMDADKIMVLDAGKLVEFGTPAELLKNDRGMFRALVDDSGDKDALYEMAARKP
ncbi:P-loop containing nucleoside triphosphate hydrolase protein [Hygrophoropsis aurantiaca]|uniref:P-loop containing nucleoside triphosphate hydrolase protein n=1 Tax=Hygrophoropsis aurantiaca TaxID=72124 RepID=A0ACB8A6C8_9AGAM|nr:P-loop containing nucleoside triphosphate hydrolase protein [Hygrophoropsis aurantiaca]